MPGDDHHDHADRQDQDVAVLHEQVVTLRGSSRTPVGEELEQRDERREGDEHAVLAHVAADGSCGCSAPRRPVAGLVAASSGGDVLGHGSACLSLGHVAHEQLLVGLLTRHARR